MTRSAPSRQTPRHARRRGAQAGGTRRRRFEPRIEQRLAVPVPEPGVIAQRYRHRDHWRRRALALGDACAMAGAMVLATSLAGGGVGTGHVWWALLTLPAWTVLFAAYGLYSRELKRVSHSTVDDVPWLFHALIVGTLLSWLYYEVFDLPVPTRELLLFASLGFGLVMLARMVMRRLVRLALARERVLLIGEGEVTKALVRKIRSHAEYGLDPVGILSGEHEPEETPVPVLGDVSDLAATARTHEIDRVLVSNSDVSTADQVALLRQCRELGVKVSLLPQVFDAMGPSVEVDDVEGVTVLGLNPPVMSRPSRLAKRGMDLCGVALLAIPVAPLMLLSAAAIKLTSRGDVFFRQKRIGHGGRPFEVIKFRTMYADAEERLEELRRHSRDPKWLLIENDPRITPVGRILRNASLDELPQLWNVLRGEMSLVGPRPLVESEDRLVDGWGRSRLALTPGITGFWQVLGRTNIPFDEMVKLDYLYIANWSVWSDIRLILRTLPAVLSQRGAN
jgi:exopolysaccharide biosynthesis polyprenyl glycosylphosphotransferase